MERSPQAEKVTSPYTLLWHSEIKRDLKKIPPAIVEKMVDAVRHRLSLMPDVIGEPLKGTNNLVWKIRFSEYRILYVIRRQTKEVWVLSVHHRRFVYTDTHLQHIMSLALALQKQR